MPIKLPKPNEVIEATRIEPKLLIMYSMPKTGKTSASIQLPDSLLIDLENRGDEISAVKFDVVKETEVKLKDSNKNIDSLEYLKTLYELGEEIKKAKKPYKRIIIDSVTKLEDWCENDAEDRFRKSPMGKGFNLESIFQLDYGKGYDLLRKSFIRWVGYIITLADTVILNAHVKAASLENNITHKEMSGGIVNSADLDLTGKVRKIACAASDAIGFMYRKTIDTKGNTITMLTFKNSGEILCGSPYIHLNNKSFEFGVPQFNELGELERVNFNWSLVFPSLNNKTNEI